MPPISSNQVVSRSYHRAVAFVKREDDRRLTQREYLDATFGVNPRTGKRYNERTLRKWLTGERRVDKPVARAKLGGGTFNVSFAGRELDAKGKPVHVYSVNVDNTYGASRLDIFTPKRRAEFNRTAKKALDERITTPTGIPVEPKPGEIIAIGAPPYKKLKSTTGLKPLGTRHRFYARKTVILDRGAKVA